MNTVTTIPINENDISDFELFVKDHIKQFNSIPMEFESSSGHVYNYGEVWEAAEKLRLTELIDL